MTISYAQCGNQPGLFLEQAAARSRIELRFLNKVAVVVSDGSEVLF